MGAEPVQRVRLARLPAGMWVALTLRPLAPLGECRTDNTSQVTQQLKPLKPRQTGLFRVRRAPDV